MNPLTRIKKTKILRNIFLSFGAIFALVTAAHAQNLYVSANVPGGNHAIFEYTPDRMQSTYATGLNNPRGLAFDSIGNLFATTAHNADDIDLGKVLKFNPRNHVNTVGSAAHFFFEGLAIDIAGNAYVMATDDRSPTGASTIFKFTPNGDRIVFGSIPGQGWGLAFDSTGNLYAAEGGINFGGERAIYKFAPDGTSTVFADSDQFAEGEYPIGLAFDSSSGNLYVSIETFTDPEADSIVYFTPMGVKSTFATRLTTPRGLAFDSSRNLFVAEANAIPDGDILKFTPGGVRSTFGTGFGRPEFLTFGPPR